MKTHHSLLATFFLLVFLQILPAQAQRSSGSRGDFSAIFFPGYNIKWDLYDGVLRIWSEDKFTNPVGATSVLWKDCIIPYKAYMKDPASPHADKWNFHPEGDDHWKGLEDISPAYPPFTETPRYPLRELVRQIQIDGSIYYIGSFSLCYFPNCRLVILHDGMEELAIGAISHLHNPEHVYFPSSLEYTGALTFLYSPDHKWLELVCNIPEPVKLIRSHYNTLVTRYICWSFNVTNAGKSFLHVTSEETVGLYRDWWETGAYGFLGN